MIKIRLGKMAIKQFNFVLSNDYSNPCFDELNHYYQNHASMPLKKMTLLIDHKAAHSP